MPFRAFRSSQDASAQISPIDLTKCKNVNPTYGIWSALADSKPVFSLVGWSGIVRKAAQIPVSHPPDVNIVTFCQIQGLILRKRLSSPAIMRIHAGFGSRISLLRTGCASFFSGFLQVGQGNLAHLFGAVSRLPLLRLAEQIGIGSIGTSKRFRMPSSMYLNERP